MNDLFQENLTGQSSGTLRRQRLPRNAVSKLLHFNSLPRVFLVFCLVSFKLLFTFHPDLSFCKCKSPYMPLLSAMLWSFSSVSIFLHGLSPSRGLALPLLQVSHLPKTNITISVIWPALFQLPLCCLCISVLCSLGFSFEDNAPHRHLPLSFIFQFGTEELYHLSQCGPRTSWADLITSFCDMVPGHHTFCHHYGTMNQSHSLALWEKGTLHSPLCCQGLSCYLIGGWLAYMEGAYGWSKGPEFNFINAEDIVLLSAQVSVL